MHPQVWDVVIHLYRETNRANWKITVFHGSIIYRLFFSIAILVQPLLAQFAVWGAKSHVHKSVVCDIWFTTLFAITMLNRVLALVGGR